MPELPEVEVLVRGLEGELIGRIIRHVEINKPTMWQGQGPANLIGQKIASIERVAKLIVISLSGGLSVLIHLKMTGQLIFTDQKGAKIAGGHPDDQFLASQPSKYTHVFFDFDDGSHLYFNDMRQFGYVKVVDSSKLLDHKHIATIGVDPFATEFTAKYLFDALQKRPKTTVKQVLMDQTVIGGIGNIYCDESLFEAKILPTRKANSITKTETVALRDDIIKTLEKGIKYGGTSYKDYVHHNGARGTMQDHLKVYRRYGQKCVRCGNVISRTIIGGRGTHFCAKCQK